MICLNVGPIREANEFVDVDELRTALDISSYCVYMSAGYKQEDRCLGLQRMNLHTCNRGEVRSLLRQKTRGILFSSRTATWWLPAGMGTAET